jgi:hypothetical protein
MRRITRVAVAALVIPVAVAFMGCRAGSFGSAGEVGSGNVASETREVGDFHRLDVESAIHATVVVGGTTSVKVTADDNLLDNVTTSVSGDRLSVAMSGSTNTRNGVDVEIVVPSLSAVHAGSAAIVEVTGLAADELRLEADSAGRITAAGSAPTIDLRAGSAAVVELGDLAVARASVSIDSAAHAWLHASDHVTGSVTSAGLLTLVGKPVTIDVSTDLTGHVVQE